MMYSVYSRIASSTMEMFTHCAYSELFEVKVSSVDGSALTSPTGNNFYGDETTIISHKKEM